MIFEKKNEKNYCFISPKQKKKFEDHPLYQKLTLRCQKIVKSVSNHFWKLTNKFWGPIVHGDHLSMGTECLGTIYPGGPNWLRTVCLEGPIN